MHGSRTEAFPAPKDPVAGEAPAIPVLRGHFAARWNAWGAGRQEAFLARLLAGDGGSFPLVEPSPDGRADLRAVTFLHVAPDATAVILSANALVDHRNTAASEFERHQGTGLWVLTYLMPADWECGYRITVHRGPGQAPWQAATMRRAIRMAADAGGPDPLNPVLGAGMNGGAMSVVRLPGAPAAPWLAAARVDPVATSPVMGGVLAGGSTSAASEGLAELQLVDSGNGRLRTVWIYSPAPGSTAGPTPLLILHDGQVWAKHLNLKATLDAAVRDGVVPALHVAMVDSFDGATRSQELSGPVGTVDFVAEDLLPVLRRTLPVRTDAAGTIVSGASYGGLASLWQVARHPDLVGVALAQSPSLWRYDLAEPLARVADRVVLRLQAGIYEAEIHATSMQLLADLVPLGADISLCSVTGGHDWSWWNPWLIHGLADLLG
nr:alpha/beta hydrolase-fold protein [Arthrobacter stackebrandtii]